MSEEVECPYCNKKLEYSYFDVEKKDTVHIKCPHCDKKFAGTVEYKIHLTSTKKADCLNGSNHILTPLARKLSNAPLNVYNCQVCNSSGTIYDLTPFKWCI